MIVDPLLAIGARQRDPPIAGEFELERRGDAEGFVDRGEGRLAFVEIAARDCRKGEVVPANIVETVDLEGEAPAKRLVCAREDSVVAQRREQVETRRTIGGIRALARPDCGVAAIFIRRDQAAARPGHARDRTILLLEIAAVGRGGEARAGFQPVIVAPQDDVGNAGDRIRAVDCRRAVGHDFDAVDGTRRDSRHVDALLDRRIGQSMAIEQGKGRVAAEAAQID